MGKTEGPHMELLARRVWVCSSHCGFEAMYSEDVHNHLKEVHGFTKEEIKYGYECIYRET